jgi:hypothetical protein
MMARCYNPEHESYFRYGGRGIKVCERWHDVSNFIEDMGRNLEGLTLERDDGNLDYSKSNCRWATRAQQNRNMRRRCDNTTGVAGVDRRVDSHGSAHWRARWHDLDGKSKSKWFSVSKYGEDEAFRLACETREAALKENGYSPKHGK